MDLQIIGKELQLLRKIQTSCSKNNDCPPWYLEASEIKHDKNKTTNI